MRKVPCMRFEKAWLRKVLIGMRTTSSSLTNNKDFETQVLGQCRAQAGGDSNQTRQRKSSGGYNLLTMFCASLITRTCKKKAARAHRNLPGNVAVSAHPLAAVAVDLMSGVPFQMAQARPSRMQPLRYAAHQTTSSQSGDAAATAACSSRHISSASARANQIGRFFLKATAGGIS